jgi:hypothetical protein
MGRVGFFRLPFVLFHRVMEGDPLLIGLLLLGCTGFGLVLWYLMRQYKREEAEYEARRRSRNRRKIP